MLFVRTNDTGVAVVVVAAEGFDDECDDGCSRVEEVVVVGTSRLFCPALVLVALLEPRLEEEEEDCAV